MEYRNYRELKDYFHNLDRAYFIDNDNIKEYASMDTALPIGYEQTISQPSLVLGMTYLLGPQKEHKVLEIGTGSGYQTALLARFAGQVYTVERVGELATSAQKKLTSLGFSNIFFKQGDGSDGWAENAPYDRIMVTAAAEKMPRELIDQLRPGGRMVIPLGSKGLQDLTILSKDQDGTVHCEQVGEVTFVEMKGKYGWN